MHIIYIRPDSPFLEFFNILDLLVNRLYNLKLIPQDFPFNCKS